MTHTKVIRDNFDDFGSDTFLIFLLAANFYLLMKVIRMVQIICLWHILKDCSFGSLAVDS